MKVRLLFLLLVPWLIVQCQKPQTPEKLVVEATIVAGQRVENVSVSLVAAKGANVIKPASNADVRLLSSGITYMLQEIQDRPGYYAYLGNDLEIVAGQEYMLWVQHEASGEVTSTVIRAEDMAKEETEDSLGYFFAGN